MMVFLTNWLLQKPIKNTIKIILFILLIIIALYAKIKTVN
jgi:hypothetical protein